ncbi:hypothetical protein GCM10011494_09540 [Novosphingobium endophyticum]|uniref:Peptidase M48 domain-containing protein n=1 Tax=Novosphingobium endophyticum TaxID=1955250 RepID=A0A916X4Z6_9SPHN|nr:M48 family metallopeptidase [Novosphingobium endophyticum]GGB93212.1 hypothetical protein GCM10011494_09540 [Novosphingobium endophyticum]
MNRDRLATVKSWIEILNGWGIRAGRGIAGLSVLAAFVLAAPASADDAVFEALRDADAAMARIGYRLATANAPLCDRLEPGLGLVLHTPGQYARKLRGEAVGHFHFDGPVGVEVVIAGSPAASSGMQADDTLFRIGTARFALTDPEAEASTAALIAVSRQIAAQPAQAPLEVAGRRNGQDFIRLVTPVPACMTRFEVAIRQEFTADADGEMVQISSRFFEEYPQDQVAAVIAHELAHNILRHRERLEKKGVAYGLLSGFGRNVRYFRQTELEADILSVSLLANAGYDPQAAVRFWRTFGPEHAGGILRSRSHPAWNDRLATIEKAIADLGPQRPNLPDVLMTRDSDLEGDWRSLLVTAR